MARAREGMDEVQAFYLTPTPQLRLLQQQLDDHLP